MLKFSLAIFVSAALSSKVCAKATSSTTRLCDHSSTSANRYTLVNTIFHFKQLATLQSTRPARRHRHPQPADATHQSSPTMCYHEYTHYITCTEHIPIHTHTCPKNVSDDPSRVIFCEDYKTVRLRSNDLCPHCPSRAATPPRSSPRSGYPTPPMTGTPGSERT